MPAVLSRAIARVFPNNVLVILLCTSTQACIYRHLLRTRNSSCVGYARASGRPVSRQQRDTCPWPHVLVRRPPRGVSHSLLLPLLLLLLCTTGNVGWSLEKYVSFLQVNTVVPLTKKVGAPELVRLKITCFFCLQINPVPSGSSPHPVKSNNLLSSQLNAMENGS